jgi:hypothetical protein
MYQTGSSTSWSPEPQLCAELRAVLETEGLVETSSFFLIPGAARMQTYRGRRHEVRLRYPVQVELVPDGRPAYVRSHGRDFHLVPVEWLASGLTHVYSLGPGLDSIGNEVLVLLAQCLGPAAAHDRLVEQVRRFTPDVMTSDAPEYGLPCLRISAAFESVRYPLCADPLTGSLS